MPPTRLVQTCYRTALLEGVSIDPTPHSHTSVSPVTRFGGSSPHLHSRFRRIRQLPPSALGSSIRRRTAAVSDHPGVSVVSSCVVRRERHSRRSAGGRGRTATLVDRDELGDRTAAVGWKPSTGFPDARHAADPLSGTNQRPSRFNAAMSWCLSGLHKTVRCGRSISSVTPTPRSAALRARPCFWLSARCSGGLRRTCHAQS